MSKLIQLGLAASLIMLSACADSTPQTELTLNPATETAIPAQEQETGSPYIPSPLSVSAIGRIEAAPDIAIVTGLIEIEDDNHNAVYARISEIINGVEATADTADTEMSYTQINARDIWDQDCLDENTKARQRHSEILSAQGHNRSVRYQIKTLKQQNSSAAEHHEKDVLKRSSKIRKLTLNRDVPEFRRQAFDQEEALENLRDNFENQALQRDKRLEVLEESIKEIKPRLAQKTCKVLNVKGQLQFTARIHPAEKAPEFMNAFAQAGVSEINLFGYDFSDYDAVYQKAADKAVSNARKKAELIAQRAGTQLKKVQAFSISQPTRFGRFGPQSKVMVTQPRYVNYVTIPPEFETYTEAVVVQEASTELVTIPATYETVTESVVVQPASSELVTVPATFKTVTETMVIQPQYVHNGQSIPAVTKQFTRRVVDTPARVVEKAIPVVTKQVTRRVVKTPASTTERVIPAITRMETRRRIKTPAQTIEQEIPANIQTQFDGADNNALRQSVLSGPQTIQVSAYMVFDYETALDDVRIRN